MAEFLRDKKFLRFIVISGLLIISALSAAFISAAASQTGDFELASLSSKAALALAIAILVYVVPRLARNVRLEFLQSRLLLNIPSAGWVFGAFILVVIMAALSTGNNLLYMVLSALLATLIISGVASRLSISDVSVSLRFPDHIFAGEPAQLEIILANEKQIVPSFSLTVAATDQKTAQAAKRALRRREAEDKDSVADQDLVSKSLGDLAYFAILPGGARARASVTRSFARRGVYPVNGFMLRTRFPFGFVERQRFIEASGEIIVYPQPQPLDDFYHLLPLSHGQIESQLRGSGSDLYGIRQYLPSDHPRHVDWKATAKTAQLMVREFTRDDDWRVTIAFDAYDLKAVNDSALEQENKFDEKFERAVIFAASLVTHFIKEGAEVRLIIGPTDSGFGIDNEHRYALLNQLARISPLQPETVKEKLNELAHQSSAKGQESSSAEWGLLDRMPALAGDDDFKILITPAVRGTIPASVWRAAHVVYFDDL